MSRNESISKLVCCRRIAGLLLFMLPVVWTGELLGTVTHEVLGHGLAAVVMGGEFNGFVVDVDGGGTAYTEDGGHELIVLAAGIVVNVIISLLLLFIASRTRAHVLLSLALLSVGTYTLLVALSYGYWGCYHNDGRTDFGRIVRAVDITWVRYGLAALFLGGFCGGLYVCFRAILTRIESLIGYNKTRRWVLVLVICLATIPFATIYDWRKLIPDAGWGTQYGSILMFWLVATVVAFRAAPIDTVEISRRSWWVSQSVGWSLSVSIFLLTWFYFSHGVFW